MTPQPAFRLACTAVATAAALAGLLSRIASVNPHALVAGGESVAGSAIRDPTCTTLRRRCGR